MLISDYSHSFIQCTEQLLCGRQSMGSGDPAIDEIGPLSPGETDIISPCFQDSVLCSVSLCGAVDGKGEVVTTWGSSTKEIFREGKIFALGLIRPMSGSVPDS